MGRRRRKSKREREDVGEGNLSPLSGETSPPSGDTLPSSQSSSGASASVQRKEEPRGFVSDIILNAIEPGVNKSVLLFLNIIFVLLLITLIAQSFLIGFNVHLIIMSILTVGLMIGVNM